MYFSDFEVKQHSASEAHKSKENTQVRNTLIDSFCKNNNTQDNKIAAQELAFVYHNIIHNLSYNSLDCNIKLLKHMLPDSANKLHLGKTKAEALALNVLGVKAVNDVIQHLKDNNIFFAIQTDASNVKNRKFFPIAVQYFDRNKGIVNKLIEFLENPDETAFGMYKMIDTTIKKHGLSYDYISGLSADNCNANFGVNCSLYTELKKNNCYLVKANCNAHVIHNTVRHLIDKLDYDAENLILKVYAHFSLSAKRRELLIEFSEFTEVEYFELTRHVTTRWLSLNKCIEKILKLWRPLISYFQSIDCPVQIRKLLFIKENEYENVPDNDIPEIYLLFLNSFLKIFEDVILCLERNNISVIEIYDIFLKLYNKIDQRIQQNYFGYLVQQKLNSLNKHKCEEIKTNFLKVYSTAMTYLKKWFDYSENSFLYKMSKLTFNHEIQFQELVDCVNVISNQTLVKSIDMDVMFDELPLLHYIYNLCKNDEFLSKLESEKWVYVLQKSNDIPNITKIINFIFSIPSITAFVERTFSIMTNKWTGTRNRASREIIKCELCINFDMSCIEFYNVTLNDTKLISQTKEKNKYNHHQKKN